MITFKLYVNDIFVTTIKGTTIDEIYDVACVVYPEPAKIFVKSY